MLHNLQGGPINNTAIKNLNISARCRSNELTFLPVIEAYLKFFFHTRNINESLFLTSKININNDFSLLRASKKCYRVIFINLFSSIYDLLHTRIVLVCIHYYSYNKLCFDFLMLLRVRV